MTRPFFPYLLALLVVPLLAACTPDPEPVVETPDPVVTAPAPAPDVTAEATLAAVPPEGLTAMNPSAAVDNIDAWIARLDGATFTNATEIRNGLMQLRNQLTTSPLDGAAIGRTLIDLGNWTTQAAGGDGALQQLGSALTATGNQLAN